MPPIKRRREPRTEDEVTGKKAKMSPTLNLPSEVSKDADGNDYWKVRHPYPSSKIVRGYSLILVSTHSLRVQSVS